jgi:small multidrug resistance pump
MAYLFLVGAIAAEVFSTSLLKSTEGFSRLWPSVAVGLGYVTSFALLAQAVKGIPVSVAYAVWSGLGTATIAAIGAAFLGESLGLVKVTGIGLIIGGVVILNLGGGH